MSWTHRNLAVQGYCMSAEESPPSPCVNLCGIDPVTGWCIGCQRTLDEIAGWGGMSDDEKRRVLEQLPARRQPEETNP